MSLTIRLVYYEYGEEKPLVGERVCLYDDALFSGGFSDSEWTDDDGEVEFEDWDEGGEIEIYVDGDSVGVYTAEEDGCITINMTDDD
jgi:hypothetical protein